MSTFYAQNSLMSTFCISVFLYFSDVTAVNEIVEGKRLGVGVDRCRADLRARPYVWWIERFYLIE